MTRTPKKITIGLICKTLSLQAHHSFSHALLPWLHDYDVKFPDFIFYRGSKQKTCKNMQWTDGLSNHTYCTEMIKSLRWCLWYDACFSSEKVHLPIKHPSWSSGDLTKAGQKKKIIRKSFNGRLYLKIIPVKSSQCFFVPAKCKGIN